MRYGVEPTRPGRGWWTAALLGAQSALAVIDFDAGSPFENTAFTYSREYLTVSVHSPEGFFPIGEFAAGTDLQTTATIGPTHFLTLAGEIWIRYDLNEHLAFRGTAPRLFSRRPDPDDAARSTDLFPAGVAAYNAATFVDDGFLLFSYHPPESLAGQSLRPLSAATTLDLDFKGVLATSGQGDGVLRVRAFASGVDALEGAGDPSLDKTQTVAKVANSVVVTPLPVRQRAKVTSGFLRFAVGSRVPLGGFEIAIDTDHRQPDGSPVGTTLADFNIDVEASTLSFSSLGAFAFAPTDGGWTLERLDPKTGQCYGDEAAAEGDPDADPPLEADPDRTVHPVHFGVDDADYPVGPATGAVLLEPWYLCATVPEDNAEILLATDYHLTVTFAPLDGSRPFLPAGVENARIATVYRDGTTVHIPHLTTAAAYDQRLVIVNRHRRNVGYVLIVDPHEGGTAEPRIVEGTVPGEGPTAIEIARVTTLSGTERASGMLAINSFPDRIDVATTLRNRSDRSTDTIVLHRGFRDALRIVSSTGSDLTTVHVPYVTSSADYVQRLTIVNRHRRPVVYELTVHPEQGGTASPNVIRGTLEPGPTTIRIGAVTTLADTDRASATLTVDALPTRIDVATTLVNRADGSTDTVVHHRGSHAR